MDSTSALPPYGSAAGISRVTVIGAGTMGVNIALNLACAGVTACLTDVSDTQLAKASENARANAAFLFSQGLISENLDDVLRRIGYESQLVRAVEQTQLVIEAVPE